MEKIMNTWSNQGEQMAALRDAMSFARAAIDEFGSEIRRTNNPLLIDSFSSLKDTADTIFTRHLEHPGLAIADDTAHLRSLFGRVEIPREDPELGPLKTLKDLRAARGNLIWDLDEVLVAAGRLGWRPTTPAVPNISSMSTVSVPLEGMLSGLVRRLEAVEDRLRQSIEPEGEQGRGRSVVQIGLVNGYVKAMRNELSLARLEASLRPLIDFVALARAISNIGRMTTDFVATVHGFAAKATSELLAAADSMRPKVRRVVSGFRALVRKVLRPSANPGEPDPAAEPVTAINLEEIQAMILRGEEPPQAWRPLITTLDFHLTELNDLRPLAGLTNLQTLNLKETRVSDVLPLAALRSMQRLDLMGTQVSDLGAVAALDKLQNIDLDGTQVSDLRPLASLKGLRSLDLQGTQVSDITALAGLLNLKSLDLGSTQVSDLMPLANLVNLLTLDLQLTPVSDVTALRSLRHLNTLYLFGTQVVDIGPLAALTSLQRLYLHNTQVADLAALAGLLEMQSLYLQGTKVSDLRPLAGLTALQTLDLRGTRVADLAPLSGLIGLKRLDLRETDVADITALAGLTKLESLDLRNTRVLDVSPLAHADKLRIMR